MSLMDDLALITDRVLPNDPSFRAVDKIEIEGCLRACSRHAFAGAAEAFILSAMRLLALAGNGHTRLIPNAAISVLPLRFVSIGPSVHLVGTGAATRAPRGIVTAINGAPVSDIEAAIAPYLAGTQQRQRVIGPILLAWPKALACFGFSSGADETEYHIEDQNGQITHLILPHAHTVPASALYPRGEHGRNDPAWEPERFAIIKDWGALGLSIQLPSFLDPGGDALPGAIAEAAERVATSPHKSLLIDLRGNTGGNFLLTLPLIDAIAHSHHSQVLALVDKFTFSAAIVFAAILKHRLGQRLTLIGEEMGDGLRFYAEGGLLDLPGCGATVRYASAFHDWETGTHDNTTPPEIARHLVASGPLRLDQKWVDVSANDRTEAACEHMLTALSDC